MVPQIRAGMAVQGKVLSKILKVGVVVDELRRDTIAKLAPLNRKPPTWSTRGSDRRHFTRPPPVPSPDPNETASLCSSSTPAGGNTVNLIDCVMERCQG